VELLNTNGLLNNMAARKHELILLKISPIDRSIAFFGFNYFVIYYPRANGLADEHPLATILSQDNKDNAT